jgi:hypothetical protein
LAVSPEPCRIRWRWGELPRGKRVLIILRGRQVEQTQEKERKEEKEKDAQRDTCITTTTTTNTNVF